MSDLTKQVHQANLEAHDECAALHDRSVPYICRRATRAYYWNLLKDACARAGNSFSNKHVLELGCGTGTFTNLVLEADAASFKGIDLSPAMLQRAREKLARLAHADRATYQASSLEAFATEHQGEFDIIFSASFLHHLVDLPGGLELIRSLLKPEGVYVAIHEQISAHRPTLIERIDNHLQYLNGYSGAIYTPLPRRVVRLAVRITPFGSVLVRGLKRILALFRRRTPVSIPPPTNYVDYQLNFDFSLSRQTQEFGKVVPYCYLGFVELMAFGAPANHEMLIMKRDLETPSRESSPSSGQ
jgi:ubiquinone/menaquinone biosynthesis C-methylase UbiE